MSPDGRRVAVARTVQGNGDIWLLDGTRTTRFTFDASADRFPIWSADGSRIVFDSNRKGLRNLYVKPSNGASEETLLVESSQNNVANDWSADGRFLLYLSLLNPQTGFDLWVLPTVGDREPSTYLKTPFAERFGRFSPDGRWVTYMSNESGRQDIYVRPFSPPTAGPSSETGAKWQVSTAGGIHPTWSPDGREVYYVAPNGQIMAAPITVRGATIEPGTPVPLFSPRIFGGGADNLQGRQYDVTRDGRFLVNTLSDATAAPITLIQNWAGALQK